MPLPNTWQFQAIGTNWTIQTEQKVSVEIKASIEALIHTFNSNYSRFKSSSIVRRMYKEPGTYVFTEPNFPKLYALYQNLYEITKGSVTPLVGDTLVRAGYDEHYTLRSFKSSTPIISMKSVQWDGAYTIINDVKILLDFGAAAKGLLVDQMAKVLYESDISEWFIDASGDSIHHAKASYTVGLEHPLDTSKIVGTVKLLDESLCASAVNRRAWKNGHHIIDGKTGRPSNGIIATWVITDSTMVADGVATALFFEWDKVLAAYPDAAFLRMRSNGTIEMNQKMKERITLFN